MLHIMFFWINGASFLIELTSKVIVIRVCPEDNYYMYTLIVKITSKTPLGWIGIIKTVKDKTV